MRNTERGPRRCGASGLGAGSINTADANSDSRLAAYGRLVKFSHTVFALPFALLATFLAADGWPGAAPLALILACMVTARSAAMTFNRIADVRIDARNPRTADRPLQTGEISLPAAWVFYALCCVGFVTSATGFYLLAGNYWPAVCAVPVLVFISGYSLAKRFTSLCHLLLGAALGLSPLGAWVAIDPGTLGPPAGVLGLAVLGWVGGFDIIYSLQDLPVDRRDKLWSLPARLGPAGALWVSRALHATTVVLLAALAPLAGLGWIYLTGVGVAAALLAIEQAMVSPRDFSRAGGAFFYANAAVSCLLAAAGVADVLLLS